MRESQFLKTQQSVKQNEFLCPKIKHLPSDPKAFSDAVEAT
jgi:hypothetical protein